MGTVLHSCETYVTLTRYMFFAQVLYRCETYVTLTRYMFFAQVLYRCETYVTLTRYMFFAQVLYRCETYVTLTRYMFFAQVLYRCVTYVTLTRYMLFAPPQAFDQEPDIPGIPRASPLTITVSEMRCVLGGSTGQTFRGAGTWQCGRPTAHAESPRSVHMACGECSHWEVNAPARCAALTWCWHGTDAHRGT